MILIASLFVPGIHAATLSGTVATTDGRPIFGAMVTAFNEPKNRKETVFTGADGRYTLQTSFAGNLTLRARTPYFKDVERTLAVRATDSSTVDFAAEKLASPEELSDSLPASAHAAMLDFPNKAIKETFVSQCNYCHQQGNSLTRRTRTEDEWKQTVRRMEGYAAMVTYGEARAISNTMFKGFNGQPVKAIETYDASPELSRSRIEEWLVGDGLSFIHDTGVGEDDKLYGIDEGHDVVWVLDRKTHEIEKLALPDVDLPVGGTFVGLQLPIGIFTGKHGPHSMAQTSDGRIWITAALSSSLVSLDPKTKAFKVYPVPRGFLWKGGIYPHTIRVDKSDIVWFTVDLSNQVARFDPKTEQFTMIDLPSGGAMRWLMDTFFGIVLKIAGWFPQQNLHLALSHHKWLNVGKGVLTQPYGIDVNPVDGSIWYAKLMTSQIGRIDPKTLEVTEYDTPMAGPRRPRFDRNGVFWIPAFDSGGLMSFDTKTKKFETWPLPRLAPNEYEIPYALNVHPSTGDVWITANNSDRILRFTPATRQFVSYPSPTRVTFLRDLEFTRDGKVCSSNANLPAYAHEDHVASFICIDPEAQASRPVAGQAAARS
ncbi:MAG TPA: carboxypeptidase regulatory-like domain-containing protein [Casimicrobiaceae bacterium]|nr:carboxypeptidase regulatory-like domain-containing protein [Casimicrobiaceae bacterium]